MSEFVFDVDLEETPALEPSDLEIVGEDIFLGPIEDVRDAMSAIPNEYARVTFPDIVIKARVSGEVGNGILVEIVNAGSGVPGGLVTDDPDHVVVRFNDTPMDATPDTSWETLATYINSSLYVQVHEMTGTSFTPALTEQSGSTTGGTNLTEGIEGGYGMSVTDHGDLAVVSGPKLAKQSVLRELINNPGSFPRRSEWGAGLPGLLFKGATQAVRDRIATRARARMLANPRVKRINEISSTVEETGIRLNIRVETLGGILEDKIVIKPPGVG